MVSAVATVLVGVILGASQCAFADDTPNSSATVETLPAGSAPPGDPAPVRVNDGAASPQAGMNVSAARQSVDEEEPGENFADKFNLYYYGTFYGPSVENFSSFQPTSSGAPDAERPVEVRNYLGLTYNINSDYSITPTACWGVGRYAQNNFQVRDPFIRVSANQVFRTDEGLSLYADTRFHLAVTTESRNADLLTAVQPFLAFLDDFNGSRFGAGLYLSVRYNLYGPHGFGDDAEFYSAPNVSYRLSRTFQANLIYEMGAGHAFGAKPWNFRNYGTNLNPGFTWDVTPKLMVNPYLIIYPGDKVNLNSTSLGMIFSWQMV